MDQDLSFAFSIRYNNVHGTGSAELIDDVLRNENLIEVRTYLEPTYVHHVVVFER